MSKTRRLMVTGGIICFLCSLLVMAFGSTGIKTFEDSTNLYLMVSPFWNNLANNFLEVSSFIGFLFGLVGLIGSTVSVGIGVFDRSIK